MITADPAHSGLDVLQLSSSQHPCKGKREGDLRAQLNQDGLQHLWSHCACSFLQWLVSRKYRSAR